jgi:formylglycine-generating enzyme required for sulfatase activity
MREGSQAMPAVFAAPGGLVITSEPSGAELTSGTREVLGKTPVELTGLAAGQPWQGSLAMEGYVPAEVKADVISGETKLVAPVKLKQQPQKVIVSSEPSGAEVVEDGKVVGSTPWESNPREVGDSVALTLRKPGHDDTGLSGEVPFGKTLILQGTLKITTQKVVVTSEPTGAEVLESGTVIGKTPMELGGQEPGKAVTYTLRLEGHEEGIVTGKVKVGEALRLSTALKALPKLKMEGGKAGEERDFEIAPGVKITMCWIPPGEFLMGSPTAELGREDDEVQHRVRITKGFWLAKYEVTQAQWRACGGVDPSARPPWSVGGEVKVSWEQLASAGIRATNFKGADLPVERVSWDEAADWCEGLNAGGRAKGGPEAEWRYGLPTEAQWEYAARGGTLTALNSGKNLTSNEGECRNLGELAWYDKNGGLRTHDVGGKKANAWGLHDMHGNVWEWCLDWYGAYPSGVAVDPVGARSGERRVGRGGSWGDFAGNCRVAGRGDRGPANTRYSFGFRVARSSVP